MFFTSLKMLLTREDKLVLKFKKLQQVHILELQPLVNQQKMYL